MSGVPHSEGEHRGDEVRSRHPTPPHASHRSSSKGPPLLVAMFLTFLRHL
jgi:hypothetical protein